MDQTELLAMRMQKTGLLEPFASPIKAEQAAIGIQAQNNTQAELNLMLRTQGQLTKDDLVDLYNEQKLIRSWGQRWTLHLLTLEDWWLIQSTRQNLKYPSLKTLNVDKFNQAFELVSEELRKQEIGEESIIKEMVSPYSSGDDNMIYNVNQKLILERRAFIDAASGNSNRSFISTGNLDNQLLTFETAVAELLKRYFTTFSPATLEDFIHWSGLKVSQVRPIFEEIIVNNAQQTEDYFDLNPVTVNPDLLHDESFIVAQFDSLLTGYVPKDWFIPTENVNDMWSKNGLLRAPIIVDGVAKGKWDYKITGKNIKFNIEQWDKVTKKQQNQLNEKFEKVATYFDKNIKTIEYK